VEVECETSVVLLDDGACTLLDGLGTNSLLVDGKGEKCVCERCVIEDCFCNASIRSHLRHVVHDIPKEVMIVLLRRCRSCGCGID